MGWQGVRVDDDDFVVGRWSGPDGGIPADRPGRRSIRCTMEQWRDAKQSWQGTSAHRWKMTGTYPNQVLTEQTDTRPLTRWIADPNGAAMSTSDGPVDYELDLGDPAGEVRIEVINESGQIRTGINATRRIPIGPYRVKVTVTNGVGTIVVPTGKARLVQVESNDFFRLENPITVSVADTEF